MRLALLCDDTNAIPWLEALVGDPNHEVMIAAVLTPAMSAMLRGRSGIRLTNHWEDLLTSRDFDAVLVGGADQQTLDAIKQLAAADHPLLFLPSADQGSTFIYELSLIRDDNHVSICPAFWHRFDPVLIELREQIRSGSLGKVRLLQFERVYAVQTTIPSQSSILVQRMLDRAELYDFDLLRWLIGDYNQVTVVQTGTSADGVLTQSVKLGGRELCEATWDARTGSNSQCRLTIHCDGGRILVEPNVDSNEWTVTQIDGHRVLGNRRDAIREFLSQFSLALPNSKAQSRSAVPIEWPELVKAFETVDATHRSVARRRTVDLHFEPMSERAIFKTQMTAMGCGVLVGTFLLTLIYLAIASAVPLPSTVLLILRSLVFAPLGIFLLLQVLYPLARPSSQENSTGGSNVVK